MTPPVTRGRAWAGFLLEIAPVPVGVISWAIVAVTEPVHSPVFVVPLIILLAYGAFGTGFGWALLGEYQTGMNFFSLRLATIALWLVGLMFSSVPLGGILWATTFGVSGLITAVSALALAFQWWPRTARAGAQ